MHRIGVGKFLYTTPTKVLSKQVQQQLREFDAKNIYCINSDNSFNVTAEVLSAFKAVNKLGCGVIIITQEELRRLPYPFFWDHKSCALIVDELPCINRYHEICVPYNFRHISDYLEIDRAQMISSVC